MLACEYEQVQARKQKKATAERTTNPNKSSRLQGEDPCDELFMFVTGEQLDEEAIKKLLKFKI